jgi:hypothetical protein
MGVDARPEGPLALLGHVTKGELCREQALVSWCSRPTDTKTARSPPNGHRLNTSAAYSNTLAASPLRPGTALHLGRQPWLPSRSPSVIPFLWPHGWHLARRAVCGPPAAHGRASHALSVPADVVYGTGRIDASDRVADQAVSCALGWREGHRLT